MKLIDRFNRTHNYLRISLTDKCNYNCIYCNPNKLNDKFGKMNLLSFEELLRVIEIFAGELEFKKFRFTGGEPLIRRDVFKFFGDVGKLKSIYGFKTGITTNGSLLKGRVGELKNSGVDSLNISLDSLNKNKFLSITQKDEADRILNVIDEAIENGYSPVKVNAVIIKGINDGEILNFVDYFKDLDVNIRFIEFMPFGSNTWQRNGFISYKEIKNLVEEKYSLSVLSSDKNSVAKDYQMDNFPAKVSFISSISENFCSTCNRVRISSTGKFRLCLFSEGKHEINFKELFQKKYSNEDIVNELSEAIKHKWEKHPEPEELSEMMANNMMTIGG
ncbi:MAG TPA: GTP 3',8-cyclase MoaA [Ignavibacteria bacterium]|nr:GTP 3',8-cyclase MoaA [Ignavibacteria bacterium]